jgi:deoxyadenosine/deoxycytidine kinase
MSTKLILIEGTSGVGKTTAAKAICEYLTSKNYKVSLHLEGDKNNPVDLPYDKLPKTLHEFTVVFTKRWQNYIANCAENYDFSIFDGAFIHHQVNDLLRINANENEISNHLQKLTEAVKPINPMLLYFYHSNVKDNLIKVNLIRKGKIPTEEKLTYWVKRQEIDLRLLDRITIDKRIIDVTEKYFEAEDLQQLGI